VLSVSSVATKDRCFSGVQLVATVATNWQGASTSEVQTDRSTAVTQALYQQNLQKGFRPINVYRFELSAKGR